jgi:hypothetical protein
MPLLNQILSEILYFKYSGKNTYKYPLIDRKIIKISPFYNHFLDFYYLAGIINHFFTIKLPFSIVK